MEQKKSVIGYLNIKKVSDLDSAELNKVFCWNSSTDASAAASPNRTTSNIYARGALHDIITSVKKLHYESSVL